MDILKLLWLFLFLNALCWCWIVKILQHGWQRRIKNMTARRTITITATVFALPATIVWGALAVARIIWSQMIHPAAQQYAEIVGIRKGDV